MSVTFVVVTVVLRDRALITDGPAVSPHTLDHLPGSAVRGMLASVCRPDEIELLIADGAVESAPGLPVLSMRATHDAAEMIAAVAYPAPRTTVGIEDDWGGAELADARTIDTGPTTRLSPVAGLMVSSPDPEVAARPAAPSTSTHQRLHRGDTAPGPFTETVLEPGAGFEIRLRIADHVADPEPIVAALREVLTRPGLRIGSGADGAYGGKLTVLSIATAVDRPWSRPSPATAAGQPVHLVLVTPALVRNPHTGECDPAALARDVEETLSAAASSAVGAQIRVTVTEPAPSVGSVRVGGFHRGYRGLRPEHWAATAGSVVTVTLDTPLPGQVWDRILSHRIGERTVDGFGLLRIDPHPADWVEEAAPLHHTTGPGARLADGSEAPAVDHADPAVRLFRHTLFRHGADTAVPELAIRLARKTVRIPRHSTLSRIRVLVPSLSWDRDGAAGDLAAVHTLLTSYRREEGASDDTRPAADALTKCRIRWDTETTWSLFEFLHQLTAPDPDPALSILRRTRDPLDPYGEAMLPDLLAEHSLVTAHRAAREGDAASWIDDHHVSLRHALVATLIHALSTGKEQA
ncbi:hypothetical protein [Rhodococcus ruber]|uniref:hypothetical protein n=1 Tax=Rhodococcus ruber TaxID=1830 RepID=UPI000C7BC9D7|nr:hypothetical protein [Rhodococcus ruber]AUM20266.1 hypothetical protein CSW53_27255 [Rhodococcus ruber]